MNGWQTGTPGILEAQHRLRVLTLRMERIKLMEQIRRARGMLAAMTPATPK